MISIILYGRNDNYGYNLHKRAALSFNCMAEVLEQEDDEIFSLITIRRMIFRRFPRPFRIR